MKYKFNCSDVIGRIRYSLGTFIVNSMYDLTILLIGNFILTLFEMYITSFLYEFFTKTTMSEDILMQYLKVFWLIQFLIVIVIDLKRVFGYCEWKHDGLFIYNNNATTFGYKRPFRRNATIPFSDIASCEKELTHNVSHRYESTIYLKFLFSKINKKYKENNNIHIPAIEYGDFSNECIAVHLKSNRIIYLPISETDDFLKEYEHLKEIYESCKIKEIQ